MGSLAGTRELATRELALQCFIPACQAMLIGIVPGTCGPGHAQYNSVILKKNHIYISEIQKGNVGVTQHPLSVVMYH